MSRQARGYEPALLTLASVLIAVLVVAPPSVQSGGLATLELKLRPAELEANDHFGRAVAIDGVVVVVGAPDDEQAATGAGVAYIYEFPIFTDGFESGDTSAWTSTIP